MSGVKKTMRKIGKISAKVLGAALGGAIAGPFGAVAGLKIGDKAGDAIIGATDKVIGKPKGQAAPAPLAMADEEEIRRAQRRALASRVGRTGRSSTILSSGDEPLG
jgi:hypothetical protein